MNGKCDSDQGQPSLEETIAKRFHLCEAPTLQAHVVPLASPIAFSRLTNNQPQPGHSLTPQPEEAFVFQMPLIPCLTDVRYSSGRINRSVACRPGSSYLLDLCAGPTRRLDKPFDNIRLYISQSTIDEFSYQNGRRRIGGLVQQGFGTCDPTLFHLSHILQSTLVQPELVSSLFLDYVALAFCEHVITRYGGSRTPCRQRRAGLVPWQMQRVIEFVEANLASNPSILDLARQCDLSASYFTEAFRQTTGVSPHQWLLKHRVERAKSKLRDTNASLASIASDCGFFDQSHFSRVFSRLEGCGPRDWRLHKRAR